ncbi:MAG: hypothetical protein ACTSRH_05030 [Promethearchaeota archaeon]
MIHPNLNYIELENNLEELYFQKEYFKLLLTLTGKEQINGIIFLSRLYELIQMQIKSRDILLSRLYKEESPNNKYKLLIELSSIEFNNGIRNLNNLSECYNYVQKSLNIKENDILPHFFSTVIELLIVDKKESIDYIIKKFKEKFPNCSELKILEGIKYLKKGDINSAEKIFNWIIQNINLFSNCHPIIFKIILLGLKSLDNKKLIADLALNVELPFLTSPQNKDPFKLSFSVQSKIEFIKIMNKLLTYTHNNSIIEIPKDFLDLLNSYILTINDERLKLIGSEIISFFYFLKNNFKECIEILKRILQIEGNSYFANLIILRIKEIEMSKLRRSYDLLIRNPTLIEIAKSKKLDLPDWKSIYIDIAENYRKIASFGNSFLTFKYSSSIFYYRTFQVTKEKKYLKISNEMLKEFLQHNPYHPGAINNLFINFIELSYYRKAKNFIKEKKNNIFLRANKAFLYYYSKFLYLNGNYEESLNNLNTIEDKSQNRNIKKLSSMLEKKINFHRKHPLTIKLFGLIYLLLSLFLIISIPFIIISLVSYNDPYINSKTKDFFLNLVIGFGFYTLMPSKNNFIVDAIYEILGINLLLRVFTPAFYYQEDVIFFIFISIPMFTVFCIQSLIVFIRNFQKKYIQISWQFFNIILINFIIGGALLNTFVPIMPIDFLNDVIAYSSFLILMIPPIVYMIKIDDHYDDSWKDPLFILQLFDWFLYFFIFKLIIEFSLVIFLLFVYKIFIFQILLLELFILIIIIILNKKYGKPIIAKKLNKYLEKEAEPSKFDFTIDIIANLMEIF